MNCSTCGKKLGFLESLRSSVLCGACARENRQALDKARHDYTAVVHAIARGVEALPALQTLDQLRAAAVLDASAERSMRSEVLSVYANTLLADGVLTEQDEERFMALLKHFDMDWNELASLFPAVHEDLIVGKVARGWMPESLGTRLLTKRGEVVHFETSASIIKEVVEREWHGGTSGFSIPLGKGFRYRVGSVRGKSVVVGSHLSVEDSGVFTISSQRIVFTGQKRTIDVPFGRLASIELFSDGVRIHASNRQRPVLFRVGSPQITAAIVSEAYQRFESGTPGKPQQVRTKARQQSTPSLIEPPEHDVDSEPTLLSPEDEVHIQAETQELFAREQARVRALAHETYSDLVGEELQAAVKNYAQATLKNRMASRRLDKMLDQWDAPSQRDWDEAFNDSKQTSAAQNLASIRLNVLLSELAERSLNLQDRDDSGQSEIETFRAQVLARMEPGPVGLRIVSARTEDTYEADFIEAVLIASLGYSPASATEFTVRLQDDGPQNAELTMSMAHAVQLQELLQSIGVPVELSRVSRPEPSGHVSSADVSTDLPDRFTSAAHRLARLIERVATIEEDFGERLDELTALLPDNIQLADKRAGHLYESYAVALQEVLPEYTEAMHSYLQLYVQLAEEAHVEGGNLELHESTLKVIESTGSGIDARVNSIETLKSFTASVGDELIRAAMLRAERARQELLALQRYEQEYLEQILPLFSPS
jgi:hypothetical protein